jgi:hypothetical protein
MTADNEVFEGDELVTETYRDLGIETAPEQLNQRILQMASGNGDQATGRSYLFAAWMKPLAWAATIGLCLALVLELSELPTAAVRPDLVPAPDLMLDEATSQDHTVNEEAAPNRQEISKDKLEQRDSRTDTVEVYSRQPKGISDAVAAPAQSSPPIAPAASSERDRAANLPDTVKPIASFSIMAEQKESAITDSCDETARRSRESWLECIDNLRRTDALKAADREYEAFILMYTFESRDLEQNK